MKKLTLTIIAVTFILSLVIAGGLDVSDSSITISKDKLDLIKATGIKSIDVKSTPIKCDDKYCYSNVKQDNLIQTEFKTLRKYCSLNQTDTFCIRYDKDKIKCIQTRTSTYCKEYSDYTTEQLIKLRDDFVKKRLEEYASKLSASKTIIEKDSGGSITA